MIKISLKIFEKTLKLINIYIYIYIYNNTYIEVVLTKKDIY